MKAAHDRSQRDAELICSFSIAQAPQVNEFDRLSEPVRERIEGLLDVRIKDRVDHLMFKLVLIADRCRRKPIHFDIWIPEEVRATTACPVDLGVAQYREQPGSGVTPIKSRDCLVGPDDGVLNQVFGIGMVTGERASDSIQHIELRKHVLFEGPLAGRAEILP